MIFNGSIWLQTNPWEYLMESEVDGPRHKKKKAGYDYAQRTWAYNGLEWVLFNGW